MGGRQVAGRKGVEREEMAEQAVGQRSPWVWGLESSWCNWHRTLAERSRGRAPWVPTPPCRETLKTLELRLPGVFQGCVVQGEGLEAGRRPSRQTQGPELTATGKGGGAEMGEERRFAAPAAAAANLRVLGPGGQAQARPSGARERVGRVSGF